MKMNNNVKPTYADVNALLDEKKQQFSFESKTDSSGSIAIKFNGKNQEYFTERQYGISHGFQQNGKWTTLRLRTVDELKVAVDNLFDYNFQHDTPTPVVNIEKHVVPVDIDDEYRKLIPNKFEYFQREIIQNKTDYQVFEQLMDQEKNVLLIGPTGSGKTTLARFYCATYQKPYLRVSLNGGATVEDLVGHWIVKSDENHNQVTVWIDGLLTVAARKGYVIVIDEINAASAEVLFKLNSLLDDERILILTEKDGETINPHKDFRLVATCNPTELGYAGTQELNESLSDRFVGSTMYIDYNEKVERSILKKFPIDSQQVDDIQKFTSAIRDAYINGEIMTPFSTRALIALADLMVQDLVPLLQYRFKQTERDNVKDLLDMYILKAKTVQE
jgi:nitric oxide reductase NorQ protein